MSKRFFTAAFLVGVFLLFSVNAGGGVYTFEVELEEGWNIIAGTIPQDGVLPGSDIQPSDIRGMWYYSPIQQDYVEIYPNTDWNGINADDEDFVLTNAMWVYSSRAGTFKYSSLEDYPILHERILYEGYNLLSITEDMVGITLNGMKGDCVWQRVGYYGTEGGVTDWWNLLDNPNFMDQEEFRTTSVGKGILVKVAENCELNDYAGSVLLPPALPEDTSNCKDSDGGIDYNVQGTVTDIASNNAVYTDFCLESGTSGPVVPVGRVLREHYCGPSNYQYEFYDCPTGCINGACR